MSCQAVVSRRTLVHCRTNLEIVAEVVRLVLARDRASSQNCHLQVVPKRCSEVLQVDETEATGYGDVRHAVLGESR
jgi:hypothetical protein